MVYVPLLNVIIYIYIQLFHPFVNISQNLTTIKQKACENIVGGGQNTDMDSFLLSSKLGQILEKFNTEMNINFSSRLKSTILFVVIFFLSQMSLNVLFPNQIENISPGLSRPNLKSKPEFFTLMKNDTIFSLH